MPEKHPVFFCCLDYHFICIKKSKECSICSWKIRQSGPLVCSPFHCIWHSLEYHVGTAICSKTWSYHSPSHWLICPYGKCYHTCKKVDSFAPLFVWRELVGGSPRSLKWYRASFSIFATHGQSQSPESWRKWRRSEHLMMMQGHSSTAAAAGGEGHARWQQEPSCIKVIASEATWSCIKSFNFFQEKEFRSLFHDLLRFYLKFVMFSVGKVL